ncbi:Ser-Thr-rich glycosyl-phosphatidyl-inositol-anchored membrane family-domain-containing protein [Sordaria brevicollis]|uniref:Ser-Thr-rich glycosyl-phosphatidyl-inositol-anchored membrane family-domain-containing protein n=1 Tax=Sordaria brevicollis TaxID=83679 RepID=A0AAE0UAZ6_SORBR|nr:Ser-Thr-rich glycosyl-phosphatidyl-inositol-anchored membrane family-domain-containing protein [Sordaria brevicollis]
MKFSVATVSAFVAYALAKPALTNVDFNIQEGVDYTLEWIDAEGPVTITLMTGPDAEHMTPYKTIATGVTGDSYTWTPADLPSDTYAFKIADGPNKEDENYSVRFPYVGSAEPSSASSTLSTITKTTTSTKVSSTAESSTVESSSAASSTDVSSTITSAASSVISSATSAAATSSDAAPTSDVPNTNNAERFASPLALILGTVAALVFFN